MWQLMWVFTSRILVLYRLNDVHAIVRSASKDTALEKVYSDLLKKTTPHEKSIMRDLGRTFPHHEFFVDGSGIGQENLFNVLKAYSL